MKPLPRLASIALAARCAELIGTSLGTLWNNVPEVDRQLYQVAISGAEETAKTGLRSGSLDATADDITRLVGRLEIHLHGYGETVSLPKTVTSLEDGQIRTIAIIIDLAARAARAATASDANGAFDECRDGVSWAYAVVKEWGDHDLEDELTRTIRSLYECCESLDLTDDSKVWWTGYDWNSNP